MKGVLFGQTIRLDNHIDGFNEAVATVTSFRDMRAEKIGFQFYCYGCGTSRNYMDQNYNGMAYEMARAIHRSHICPRGK